MYIYIFYKIVHVELIHEKLRIGDVFTSTIEIGVKTILDAAIKMWPFLSINL